MPQIMRHPGGMGEAEIDASGVDAVRRCLDAAAGLPPIDALPHLREAAELLTDLLDETMAAAVLSGQASVRASRARAGSAHTPTSAVG